MPLKSIVYYEEIKIKVTRSREECILNMEYNNEGRMQFIGVYFRGHKYSLKVSADMARSFNLQFVMPHIEYTSVCHLCVCRFKVSVLKCLFSVPTLSVAINLESNRSKELFVLCVGCCTVKEEFACLTLTYIFVSIYMRTASSK